MTGNKVWRQNAFSLIELLVVIAIIIVLAGLIMPAIKGARERGRDVLCKNHLKELQVAAMSVAISGNGTLPHSKSTEGWSTIYACEHGELRNYRKTAKGWVDWVNWVCHHDERDRDDRRKPGETPWWGPDGLTCITNGALWPYVKSTKTYACPQWQRKGVCGAKDPMDLLDLTFGSDTNNKAWRCYVMNRQVSGANIGNFEGSKYILFTEAGNTNFLADGTQLAERNMTEKLDYTFDQNSDKEAHAWDGDLNCTTKTGETYPKENVGLYHNGRANAVFVDGHIEKVTWNVTTNACSGDW